MRISKERAEKHCNRQDLIKDNGKHLRGNPNRKKIRAGWDAFALKMSFRTLKVTGDGSSRMFEWVSNLNVKEREGFHGGFYRAAVKGYRNLKKELDHPIRFYDKWDGDGHSRGVYEFIMQMFYWAEYIGLQWDQKTGKG